MSMFPPSIFFFFFVTFPPSNCLCHTKNLLASPLMMMMLMIMAKNVSYVSMHANNDVENLEPHMKMSFLFLFEPPKNNN